MNIKRTFVAALAVATALMSGISASAQTPEQWKKLKSEVNLYVANDLGRNGYYDQKPVAEMMGKMAETIKPECVIAPGDIHHFNGVASTNDPLWLSNFENIYTHPELMIDWFPALGNHEYRGNTQAVLDYGQVSRRWMMPARYYSKVLKNKNTTVRIVLIDTAPLLSKYRTDSETYPDACKQDDNKQLEWLDNTLRNAKEDWVIVLGHHPIYAETPKSEDERTDMQTRVMPILHKYNNVAMYVCGHIHDFQHISMKGDLIEYVVNTSASQSRKVHPIAGTVYCSSETGFSVISASKQKLSLYMIDKNGNVLHTVSKTK